MSAYTTGERKTDVKLILRAGWAGMSLISIKPSKVTSRFSLVAIIGAVPYGPPISALARGELRICSTPMYIGQVSASMFLKFYK